ncbi:MAG: cytochrome c5 family protein [Proteobacteria bacterium]|nr:cytochrome c5 family protein [Pseudomonadota bacterium]
MKLNKLFVVAVIAIAAPILASADEGADTYNAACTACHGPGIAGAPKVGDAAAWKDRISKGEETLVKHAIEGFQGDAGMMPPKGGRMDISDEAIAAAVKYMIAQASE